jgi:hypothetical protein
MSAAAFCSDPETRLRLRSIRCALVLAVSRDHANEMTADIEFLWEHSTFAEWTRVMENTQMPVTQYLRDFATERLITMLVDALASGGDPAAIVARMEHYYSVAV